MPIDETKIVAQLSIDIQKKITKQAYLEEDFSKILEKSQNSVHTVKKGLTSVFSPAELSPVAESAYGRKGIDIWGDDLSTEESLLHCGIHRKISPQPFYPLFSG